MSRVRVVRGSSDGDARTMFTPRLLTPAPAGGYVAGMPDQAQLQRHMPPGPERRSTLRRAGHRVRATDFTEDEWLSIEDEAPGTRAAIEELLQAADD